MCHACIKNATGVLHNLIVCSAAKQDYQQQNQLLQEQITKLQQEVQKLKPLEGQLLQTQQQQQPQSTQPQLKGRESVDEEGSSNMLKIPASGSRAGGKLFKKRVSFRSALFLDQL